MNAVIYYSDAGQSRGVAEYLAKKSGFDLYDIYGLESFVFRNAVLVFPVHCQNIPAEIKQFLSKLSAENLAVVATYGKKSFGNTLFEAQKITPNNIVAAAYVPSKHAYLNEKGFEDFEKLDVILNKFKNPAPVKIKKSRKNIFADFLPGFRSRLGVKLYADAACDKCGACNEACKRGAIDFGKPKKNCIRCLRCVAACPQKALRFSLRPITRLYLKTREKTDLIIYV